MQKKFQIDAFWDDDAKAWLAICRDIVGRCVEAETWSQMIEEVHQMLPDLALDGTGLKPGTALPGSAGFPARSCWFAFGASIP